MPRLCGFPRRIADVHCSKATGVVLSSGLASSFESCPAEPGRCAAAHRQLSWTLRLYSTCWEARATVRRRSTAAYVAPSGFGYPLGTLLSRTPAPDLFQSGSAREIRGEALACRDCADVSARRGPPVVSRRSICTTTGIAPRRAPSTSGPTHRDLPPRPAAECLARPRRSRSAIYPFKEQQCMPRVRPFARSFLTLGQFGDRPQPGVSKYCSTHTSPHPPDDRSQAHPASLMEFPHRYRPRHSITRRRWLCVHRRECRASPPTNLPASRRPRDLLTLSHPA